MAASVDATLEATVVRGFGLDSIERVCVTGQIIHFFVACFGRLSVRVCD